MKIAVFDFETTGPNPKECWPVSVAIGHLTLGKDDFKMVYSTKIKPPIPIPEEAAAVHGITDEMVKDSPTMEEVVPKILSAIGNRSICAYNLPFDWSILRRFAGKYCPEFRGIDPLPLAKKVDKYKKSKSLTAVCERRGIRFDAHNAEGDVEATAKILPLLLGESGVSADDWGEFVRLAVEAEEDFENYCAKNGRKKPDSPWRKLTDNV